MSEVHIIPVFGNMKLVDILIACCILSSYVIAQDCVWNRETEFPTEYPPLLMDLSTWQAYLPEVDNGENVVRIEEQASVVVACPGETLDIGGEVAEGICQAGFLVINGQDYHIRDLACDARVVDDAVIDGGQTCANGEGTPSKIGFNVAGYKFYKTIEICFDTENKISITAKYRIYGNSVDAWEEPDNRPSFKMGDGFYNSDPKHCYLTPNQDAYFTTLLGDPNYIDANSNKYFSRGHLAPNTSFVIEMEADASYYYINAIPQWQAFKKQNWEYVEAAIRSMSSDHGTDLDVWTGPYGQLILEDIPIFLCASQGNDTIPIPELVWKIVYEEDTNSGLAIVISNLPHEEFPSIICTDLNCESINWLADVVFEPRVLTRGYTYCCTVQDLKSAVPNAPDLPNDVQILLY